MKIDKTVVAACCLVAACGVSADPVDGYYWANGWYHHLNTFESQLRYWEGNVVPSDGGVAYFTGTAAGGIYFSSTVTLRGLDFGNVQLTDRGTSGVFPRIMSSGLVLTGDDAFIYGTGRGSATIGHDRYAVINATVSGTGDNTLTVKGAGYLTVNTPFANFGTLVARGGDTIATATSGNLYITSGATALRGGILRWAPSLASGESAAATMGSVTYGSGFNELSWSKGSGDSATLTLASLAAEGDGSTLWIRPNGSLSTLGDTEKLMVTTPPTLVNGIIDPGVVVHDETAESYPLSFTTYDETRGVIPYPSSSMVDLSSAAATDVAVVSATNTLSETKQVAALVVDNTANLEIADGVTLTVGDNDAGHRAGVVFNRQNATGTNVRHAFAGAGTLDFGASPGIFWTSSPSIDGWGANRILDVNTKITGQNGVTFASHTGNDGNKPGIIGIHAGYNEWSGPTRVSGAILWVFGEDALPEGDIYVEDGDNDCGSQFRFDQAGWTMNQNFFLSGSGPLMDGNFVMYLQNGMVTLNGAVTLTGDAAIGCASAGKGGIKFRNRVGGPGSLILKNGGTFNFYTTNSYDSLDVTGATALNMVSNGTFGAGRVWLRGNSKRTFGFKEVSSLTVTNDFRVAGTLDVSLTHAKVAVTKDLSANSLSLTNFSELAIGGDFTAGKVMATGSRNVTFGTEQVKACSAGAVLGVGDSSDFVLGLPLSDGTGTLGLTKNGTGTVELPLIAREYTGPTTVAAGTLKLNDNPLLSKSLVYWLDASCEDDFEKDATTGAITKWNSHGGSKDISFSPYSGSAVWGTAEKINGLNVVSMNQSGTTADRLGASASADHHTVFVVCRTQTAILMGGLIGKKQADVGFRMNSGSGTPSSWEAHSGGWTLNTTGTIRRDGVKGSAIDVGNTHIFTLIHDRDGWAPSVTWSSNPTASCDFTAALGGYYSMDRYYAGDYCEILAFDRVLTEPEMRVVENYLSEKWLDKTIWTDTQATPLLPSATALTVETGAMLDLAGCSVTVASLTGNGTITNSSSTAATLTVTGGGSFTGKIGGNTTVSLGADSIVGAALAEGASVIAAGGTLSAGDHLYTPPTNGLAYWCDAGRRDTILLDDSNCVTGWVSRASSSSSMLVSSGTLPNSDGRTKPTYSANALGGKPCLAFTGASDAIWSSTKTPVRSVFIALAANGSQTRNCAGVWGVSGADRGFRFSNNSTTIEGGAGGVRPTGPGDWVSLDGVSKGTAGLALGDGTVCVIGARLELANHVEAFFVNELGLGTDGATRATVLGKYYGNPSFVGYIGEVVAYDRALSDSEMKQVENYLIEKWKTASWTEGNPPDESESGLVDGTLSVADGATVAVADGTEVGTLSGAGTLSGDVTADGFEVTVKVDGTTDTLTVDGTVTLGDTAYLQVNNPQNLQNGVFGTFLQAEGITGRFSGSNLEKPNGWRVTTTKAQVFRSSGFKIILR